ncbi:hypothetical protein A3K93_03190 [Acinetobacter sp. NCu2D-2]|uniref:sensor domain-containing diguanylate cyclase n=1 Tax=Acinetobacter sp. NCu2D-2 TaxID=1608473 RepID=UPI0007CDF98C|nr:sensor domain-containing diguanylate cyclase [Acinetobacter sp. NCu2D-2]ANF81298.1 hypothetical protein A3K93_03190 [Acinetobacter sp. NCu2D-2]
MSLLIGACATIFIEKVASDQMTKAMGLTLFVAAKSISNTLANSLNEREREIVLLSQSPLFEEMDLNHPRIQKQLDQVQKSYLYYAWMGIADPEGEVKVAAHQLLEGADVSQRDWFIEGKKQPYIGDVHEAILLAKKVKAIDPEQPLRFIDFAAPIVDAETKTLKGVLAVHADWSWAKSVLESSLTENATKRGVEVFITDKNGELLYPYSGIGKIQPPAYNPQEARHFIHNWGSEQKYLTVNLPVISNTATDLGWHVVIRQPVEIALSEVKSLQYEMYALGLAFALILLFFTYRLARRFSTPIEILARNARLIEKGQQDIDFKTNNSIREIRVLSNALRSMVKTLLLQKQQLQTANENLEHKVNERTAELKAANTELEMLASRDVLTGLKNRRAFNEYIEYLFAQFKRHQQSYSVLMLDIDYFKKVNDKFGHEMGDHVLHQTAEIINQSVRSTDFVARLGGEEFIIILPSTTAKAAFNIAEKIRHQVAQATIISDYVLTLSIGVSEVVNMDELANAAVRRADQALYMAKAQGRNQVVMMNKSAE